ncbi:MAG: tetratricopeptide repeat protein [Halofilum sp. (in: g-proteobacteria)]|nr:tetratricopeptide repeat protein [Halofilum sp. (in: g-proteobacteria)]
MIAARAHLALGEPARAIENLTRLISVDPGAVGARLLLGRAYAAAGDAEAAVEQVEKELAANPDNVEAQIVMARARLQQGREQEARALIAALPERAAGRPLALETRAMLAMNAGDFPAAADAYRQLLEVVPAGGYVIKLATALRRAGRTDEAVTALDDWLARNPDDAAVWLAAGDVQVLRGNEAAAISAYRSALEADPESATAMNNIAWLLRERDPDEALRLAERAVELQPASAAVRDTLGMVLLARGEPEAAVESFRAGLARASDSPDLNHHLARALVAAGRQDEAREPLRRALESGASFAGRAEAEALLEELDEGP